MKIDKYLLIFIGLAVIILWQGLMPGYILGLDMVFGPEMQVVSGGDAFSNGLIVNYLIFVMSSIIPVWIVQKIILSGILVLIGYSAFKYLPIGENKEARMFSSLIYLANPFVYSRLLAGQWTHLMGYAFLPLFFHQLLRLRENNGLMDVLKVFGAIFLISLFSLHFCVMACMIFLVYGLYLLGVTVTEKKDNFIILLRNLFIGGISFLIAISYWLVPALSRTSPIEQRLSLNHWEIFSAGSYKGVDVLLNVLSLNGFWGERNPWAKYFVWPQDTVFFWVAFTLIMIFILIGLINGFRNKKYRELSVFFGILAILSYVFSLGVSETVFKGFNLWFYEHIPFWSGFRDSQKFSGILAYSYAVFAGLGFVAIYDYLKKTNQNYLNMFLSTVLVIPVLFGCYTWGGLHRQFQPIQYPDSWAEAKKIIEKDTDGKVLFLPWHLYISLDFNNKLVTANPALRYFGERIIYSKSVDMPGVRNQESDKEYFALDNLIIDQWIDNDEKIKELKEKFGVSYIIKIDDLDPVDDISYGFLSSEDLELQYTGEKIKVYKIKGE
ncbi:MAG: hypothetical protein PHW52_02600 [Candidatus Pacebacteria bacterium]|nr:hypothetical protein [Candidatus Paceibacterota bacterium]